MIDIPIISVSIEVARLCVRFNISVWIVHLYDDL